MNSKNEVIEAFRKAKEELLTNVKWDKPFYKSAKTTSMLISIIKNQGYLTALHYALNKIDSLEERNAIQAQEFEEEINGFKKQIKAICEEAIKNPAVGFKAAEKILKIIER